MDETQRNWIKKSGVVAAVLLLGLLFCLQAQARGIVSGRYLVKTATELRLEIKVAAPAPASLIIIQHLPPGTSLTAANPAYKKYNAETGEVRWLLRRVQAGTLTLHLKLSGLTRPDQVSAEIRCMDPATGRLLTTQVK